MKSTVKNMPLPCLLIVIILSPVFLFLMTVITRAAAPDSYDQYQLFQIQVQYGETLSAADVLQDEDGILYFSENTIYDLTGYSLDMETEPVLWCFRNNGWDSAYRGFRTYQKNIYINYETKTAAVGDYVVQLSKLPVYQNSVWFPIAGILPLMDVIAYVEDGVLMMNRAPVSLADAMQGFQLNDYYFDMDRELGDDVWKNDLKVSLSYLYEKIKDRDISFISSMGTLEDYETCYKELLTDRDAYGIALGYDPTDKLQGDYKFSKTLSKNVGLFLKSLSSIHDAAEYFDEYDSLFEGGYLVENFHSIIPAPLFGFFKTLSTVKGAFDAAADITFISTLMVNDHARMLAAVYPAVETDTQETMESILSVFSGSPDFDKLKLFRHIPVKVHAARTIYRLFGDTDMTDYAKALYQEITVSLLNGSVSTYISTKLPVISAFITFFSEFTDTVLTDLDLKDVKSLSLMNHYITLHFDAVNAYDEYIMANDGSAQSLENIRLSAIMALLTAKKLYEIKLDNSSAYKGSYDQCRDRIDNINQQLALLYLASEGVLTDGVEFYALEEQLLRQELKNLTRIETAAPDTANQDRIRIYGEWFLSHMNQPEALVNNYYDAGNNTDTGAVYQDDFVYMADLTGDGLYEMIVTHYADDTETYSMKPARYNPFNTYSIMEEDEYRDYYSDNPYLQIFTIRDNTVAPIYALRASLSHIGYTYLLLVLKEDGNYLFNLQNSNYQGYISGGYQQYIIGDAGGRIDLASESWDGEVPPAQAAALIERSKNNGIVVLNTQYPDIPREPFTIYSWYKETSSPTDDSNFLTLENDGEESIVPADDPVFDSLISDLVSGLFITNLDNQTTFWVSFSGEKGSLTMHAGITEMGIDLTVPVMPAFTAGSPRVLLDDSGQFAALCPVVVPIDIPYAFYYDYENRILSMDVGQITLTFEDLNRQN